jgi:MFS family permease
MPQKSATKAIAKRLLSLYIAAALQSFVLWYTIEKLFMHSIGFNDTTIGIMIAVYSAVMLLVDTPSGIIADRWSRKGVLIIASVCMAFSSLAGGMSHGVPSYLIAAVFWGIFFACYQGVYDSIVTTPWPRCHQAANCSINFLADCKSLKVSASVLAAFWAHSLPPTPIFA